MSYNYAPPATPTFTASFGNAGSSELRNVLFGDADTEGSCMKLSATAWTSTWPYRIKPPVLRREGGRKCRLQFSLPHRYECVNCRIPLLGLRFAATSCRASHAYPCLFLLDTDTGSCRKTCPTIMHPLPLLLLRLPLGMRAARSFGTFSSGMQTQREAA